MILPDRISFLTVPGYNWTKLRIEDEFLMSIQKIWIETLEAQIIQPW